MSCLNLKLFPSTKAWRIFTKKLQLKRLNKPKLIKKPKTQYNSKKTCKKFSWPLSLSVHPNRFKINKRSRTSKTRLCYIQNRGHLPVFVDQLFVEHVDSVLKPEACEEKIYHHLNESRGVDREKNRVLRLGNMDENMSAADDMRESLVMGSSSKISHHLNESRGEVDSEKNSVLGLGNMDEKMSAADDMWESLVMGSSQMERIDERAEEFIAKFRAEMQNQEKLARYS